MADLVLHNPDFANQQIIAALRARQSQGQPQVQPRMAGEKPGLMEMLSGMWPFGGKQTAGAAPAAGAMARLSKWAPRAGAVALPLAAIASAAGELNNDDPTVTDQQRVLNATGAGAGTLVGGGIGAALGSFGGPLGTLIGGGIGSWLGDTVGKGLAGVVGPSPEERALASQLKAAMNQTEAEKYRLETLMPIQQKVAEAAVANEVRRAAALQPLQQRQMLNEVLAASIAKAQDASNAQALAMTQGLMGGIL